ncbi:protein eva-1 homolog C isoform X5 [Scyliorhinus canicula]|uniref:protein eva-1 homolog C isoform X5 n=1 Tax=Scyliorhinus canicula TaxID=7830 RepID=UPI0018F5E293|nr:protein eva-1 homolog C isoform X5 [Scyliorhinus canicula]
MITLKQFRCQVGFSFVILFWFYLWGQFEATPDFSGYLLKILQNHTVHACDRDRLSVSCPPQTSISILSAFYGRRVPSEHLCPSTRNTSAESINCAALTAIPKVFDECQDQSSCQFSVNSRIFGLDPCPGTNKYLIVSFKCKPDGHRSKLACENEELLLQCQNQTILVIYAARFGRVLHGNMECPSVNNTTPDIVPKKLFEEAGQGAVKPFLISDYTHGLPEKAALFFVSGVCSGLVFILCAFGFHVLVRQDIRKLLSELQDNQESENGRTKISDDEDDASSDASFRRLTQQYRASDNIFSPEVTAVMVDRVEQKEQGDREMWLNKESSPYAIQNLNQHPR